MNSQCFCCFVGFREPVDTKNDVIDKELLSKLNSVKVVSLITLFCLFVCTCVCVGFVLMGRL